MPDDLFNSFMTGPDENGSTSVASTTSADATSTDAPTTTASDSADDTDDTAAETTGAPGGMQPADGLYSHCLTPTECDPIPALCITIEDMSGNATDGYCSLTPCTNAAVDCVPTPGGTALPACIPVTLDGQATNACALDCSGGATCPTGMTCHALTIGSICA